MQRFKQPPRTIPGATVTADKITFPLDDPNDPRLIAYNDSLGLFNRSQRNFRDLMYSAHYTAASPNTPDFENVFRDSKTFTDADSRNEAIQQTRHFASDLFRSDTSAESYISETPKLRELKFISQEAVRSGIMPIGLRYFGETPYPIFKRPTSKPVEVREIKPLNATKMESAPMRSVSMRDYPYTGISKNWGRHWQTTSGRSAPAAGGFYFLGKKANGENDLLSPEEYEHLLKTTTQKPLLRFRSNR